MRSNQMEIYTASELRTFQSCPFSWYWEYYQGLKRWSSLAQLVGSAVHLGLGLRAQKAEDQVWRKEIDLLFSEECLGLISENEKIWTKLEASKVLVDHFPLDQFHILQTEIVFESKITNPQTGWSLHNCRIAGKIDALAEIKGKEGLWIVEYKTTSTMDEYFLKKLSLELQGFIYLEYFPAKVEGIVYIIIQKPLIRIRQHESEEEFCKRLDSDVTEENYSMLFQRKTEQAEAITQMQNEIITLIRYLKRSIRDKRFWHNPSTCRSWQGCGYADLCLSRSLNPTNDLTGKFRMYQNKHPELLSPEERKELPF